MRRQSPTSDTDADTPWTYRETIDAANSAIRVRGQVGRLGVDLLRGTIEDLSRRGHRNITVTVDHPDRVDPYARAVLTEVARSLEESNCRLTVLWAAHEADGGPAPLAGSGHDRAAAG